MRHRTDEGFLSDTFDKYFNSDIAQSIFNYVTGNASRQEQSALENSDDPDVRKGLKHAKEVERKRKRLEKERDETIEQIQNIIDSRNDGFDKIADEEPPGGRYW